MTPVYSSGFQPNPLNARAVLAFVLCSPKVFVPGGDAEEIAAVMDLIAPAKEAAIKRWQEAKCARLLGDVN